MKPIKLNILILTVFIITLAGAAAFYRIEIDTDVISSLPEKDPVISEAKYIFMNHPIHDQLVIDVSLEHTDHEDENNTDILVEYGERIEEKLKQSGLFRQVGIQDFQSVIPDLITYILNHLPILFTEKELNTHVLPLLEPQKIYLQIQNIYSKLLNIESIGQAEMISKDPLDLKNIIMAKLSHLAPSDEIQFYKGKLISSDGRHLLIIANPRLSGTDTHFSRDLDNLMKKLSHEINQEFANSQQPTANSQQIILTPVGTYRNALDNELIIRQDVTRSVIFATIGIALLLIFAFPRPLIGILSLLPAIAGTVIAFFVYSLVYKSVSVMVLGFGGAIISITVDHAIAYLLFLDRPYETHGRDASREIRAIGLLAALTTMGAFGMLCLTDFPIFEQLGLFTAMGIGFSFLFVHTVFPIIFPVIPPATPRFLFLQNMVNQFASLGKKGAWAALIFGCIMIFFAKPEFNVSLTSMNTVSQDTLAAENLIQKIWGSGIFDKKYLMTEGKDITEIQQKNDMLLEIKEQEDNFVSGFFPSMIFPGKERASKNFEAWKTFWNEDRVADLEKTMNEAGIQTGFTPDAFNPFFSLISADDFSETVIPEKFLSLMGISQKADDKGNSSKWIQFYLLTPEKSYDSEKFYSKYKSLARIFDPNLFSRHIGKLLFSTFMKMFFIIGAGVSLLIFFFFLDIKLTAIALLPIVFAFVSTLGTLNLMNHPIDIPGLMLSIIIMGMGIDYSLYFVKFYQRYHDESHPYAVLIRMTVFMTSASTIIGFGVLCLADHSLLRSAGIISLAGIAYALTGAFIILPPILKQYFKPKCQQPTANSQQQIIRRYEKMETYPRLFAYFKIRCDCMFSELDNFFDGDDNIRTIIDIGTGYGIPGAWLLERFPQAILYGIEPDSERIRIASAALGKRAFIEHGRAPDIPQIPHAADAAVMLDMAHYLDDDELKLTLARLHKALAPESRLIIRTAIPPEKKGSRMWHIENTRLKILNITPHYRSADKITQMLRETGFTTDHMMPSGNKGESFWFAARGVNDSVSEFRHSALS